MTRRILLLLSLAACLRADSERDVRDLIASVAGALSADKPEQFLDYFDRAMPDFDKLRYNVVSLLSQAEVSCSIEVTGNEGDDVERTLTLDWILETEHKDKIPGSTRRQKTVKVRLKKTAKKWRIVTFEPLDLFAPPGA
jgi:hypothetical protein